ncbi:hypothetical protein ABPG73_021510 [Tetrahymena malaccensis]
MDKRNYYTDSGNVNQKDVTFYTLSTGQTVVFICDVYGLLTWTVNLKDFSFQWNGYITNSTVIKQGDPFFSFTKHPTKDIIFMVLNIKSQFGLTWDNVQWLIHPFFLKNSVWVALALPYKPKTQNYLVSLINCQTGTIYNLTSNKSNVNKIQTTLAVVSLDDPNNLELIVLESSGTVIYVWDLNQSNFPFKFQTKINLSSTVSKYFVCLLQTELSQDANIAQYFETIKIQKLSIYNTTILNHFDIQLGQIQFVNNVDINIFKCINDVDFLSKIPDKQTSGCLRFSEVNALRINDINFQNKKEQDSNLLSVINIQVQQATISINKADISDIFVTQASMNTQATPVYIKSSNEVQVVIDQSNFQNVKMQILQQSFSYSSAALQVINSIGSLKISNTQFKNVYSNSIYGVIQTQTQNVVIDTVQFSNSTFSGNLQQKLFYQQGGFINAQIQNINISNTNFSQATASKGAFLFLQSSASQLSININDTSFSEGYAAIDGGSMFLDSGNNQISLKCLNCQFSNIYTLYNSASAISQQKYLLVNKNVQNIFQFNGGYIKNIFGYSDNHFIDVSNANLIFQDIPIITSEYFASDSQPFQLYSSYFDKQQATIANLQNTTLLIQNCNFCNLQKSTFSSAYPLLINSQLSQINIINATIKDSIFTSNVIQSTSSSLQIEQVQFKNISQILNKRLLQQDIYQIPSQLGYSLISTLQTTVQITKSSYFQDIYCNQNCNGGALQIQQGILNIQDTTFKNVYSNFGGSVFILGMNQTNLISNSNFINCSSQNDGGAIYFNFLMNDAFKLNINESIFNNNTFLMTLWTLVSMCLAIKGDIDVLREKAAIFAIQKHIKRKSTIRQRLQTSIYMKSLNFSKSQMLKSNQTNMKSINPNIKMEFNDDEDKSGIYIKMLTNYIQIVGSIATFNLSIPSGIFQFPQSVGQPLKRTMDSLDCVLKDIHTDMPIIYLRLLFSLTLPAIYLLIFVIDNQIKQSKSNSEVGDSMQNLNQFEQKINQMNELEQLQSQEQKQQIRDKYLHYENPITQQQQKNRKNIDSQDNKNIDEGQNFQNIEGQNQETYTSRSQQCLDSNNLIIFEAKDSQNDISYTIETANQNQLKQDTNFERTPSLITLKNEEKQKDQILQNKYMLTIRGQASIQLLKNNSCQSPKKLLFENEIIEEGLLDVIKFDDEQMYDQSSQSNQQNEEASYKQEANNKNMQITNNIQVSNTDKIDNLNRKLNNNSINKNAYSMNYIQQDLSDEENQQTQLKFKSKQTFIEDKSTMNQLETNYENRIQLEQNTVNQNQIEIKFLS